MARLEPQFNELTPEDYDAFIAVARRQAAIRVELKAALLEHDEPRALDAARRLVGVQEREVKQ
jgi:hypothetical protein